ncbi:UNVERIFIED_CONTAM: hypothetical protein HDU68_002563 [Siphonaria sp. JEL0065]|nr:hypothetical protein HDU68_002563 [Siphonaria sp. JEL0065]
MNPFQKGAKSIKDFSQALPPEVAKLQERIRGVVLQHVASLKVAANQLEALGQSISSLPPPRERAHASVRASLSDRENVFRLKREKHVSQYLKRILILRNNKHAHLVDGSKLPVVGIAARSTSDALRSARYSLLKNLILNPINSPPKVALATAIERIKTSNKVNLVDLFGVFLTASILEGVGGTSSLPKISEQAAGPIDSGALPFPIYSAVTFTGDEVSCGEKYQWVEFNPYEMGFMSSHSKNQGVWIPMSSFGRTFYNGETVANEPEIPFGILLGVFGSAFTANLHRIMQEISPDIPPDFLKQVKKILSSRLDTTHPISPTLFPNPAYKLDSLLDDPITLKPEIPVMDSGMDNSIPFAPLLNPARGVDVLIVLDASADIGLHPFLERVNTFVQKRGCPEGLFPNPKQDCKFISANHSRRKLLTRDGSDVATGPEIVYLPLVGDAAKAWYAKSANFVWSGSQVDSISSLAASHVKESKDAIEDLIIKVWEKKNGFEY